MGNNNQQKIIIMRGLPASLKSTWANNYIKENHKTVMKVNKDSIRTLLFNDHKWNYDKERQVVAAEEAVVLSLLNNGYSCVIDNTNLRQKDIDKWKDLVTRTYNGAVRIEIQDFRDVPISTCIERDNKREGKARIGRAVIERMALQNGLIPWDNYKSILCSDIDGTTCNINHRLRHIKDGNKNWDKFFDECDKDEPIEWVIKELQQFKNDNPDSALVMLSGRSDIVQDKTYKWLENNGIPFDYVFMRPSSDTRPDTELKAQLFEHIPKEKVVKIYEDRLRLVKYWESIGLNVANCNLDNVEF